MTPRPIETRWNDLARIRDFYRASFKKVQHQEVFMR